MMNVRPVQALGSEALALAMQLLHRVRLEDPTAGVWEAADLAWWAGRPRPSDQIDQLFWIDDEGPVAAALLTDWTRTWGLDLIVVPGTPAGLRAEAWMAGLAALEDRAIDNVEMLLRDDDVELVALATSAGFEPTEDGGGATWMDAAARPAAPAPPDGFVLGDRLQFNEGSHWLVARNGPAVEERLRSVSLYDPTLDLTIRTASGETAGYALFWFDGVTRVGLLEPMRTEAAWQRRGLARSLIGAGLERLAARGATRFKVGYGSDAGRALYLGAGYRLHHLETTYARRRSP
jgi:hypothetical protein